MRNSRTYKDNYADISDVNKDKQGIIHEIKTSSAFSEKLSDYKLPFKILLTIYRIFTVLLIAIKHLLLLPFKLIMYIGSHKNKVTILIVVLSAIAIIMLIDFIFFFGKVYPGVKIEGIDVGGKTKEQVTEIIESQLPDRINSHPVVVYASEDAQKSGINNENMSYVNEQISRDQQLLQTQYWEKNPSDLGISLDSEKTVNDALNSTRGIGNIFKRLGAFLFGCDQKATAKFDGDMLDYFNAEINQKLGVDMVNPNIKFEGGNPVVTAGKDGEKVYREDLVNDLNNVVFFDQFEKRNFVAKANKIPQQITSECAQDLVDKLNFIAQTPIKLSHNGNTESISSEVLLSWISTEISEEEVKNTGGCSCTNNQSSSNYIRASIDKSLLTSSLLNSGKMKSSELDQIVVNFDKVDNDVAVTTNGKAIVPNYDKVVEQLNNELFNNAVSYQKDIDNKQKSKNSDYSNLKKDTINIEIEYSNVPEKLSYQDALRMGIIEVFSSYTTTYTTGSGTQNRNHNIELVSKLLNNSICKSNGGQWSYNDTAGECNEAKGFLPAGSVVGNGYIESVGGGICQVATTIYNAVYDAGLPIVSRSPHNLYIASYPAGRDAAVSYPAPDLIWSNDQSSDCLVKVECSGNSVKCSLVGVNPHYKVQSDAGQWEEGDKYKTEYVVDPSKEPNSKFTQTTGSDGRKITVERKVFDKNNKLIRTNKIVSNYIPKTEIIVLGPGEEANKLLESHQARMKKETDKW